MKEALNLLFLCSVSFVSQSSALHFRSPPPLIHRLLLIRHGDSIWNGGQEGCTEKFTGWTDVSLSDKGRQEATATAREVVSYSFDIDVCATSILSRAQKTAAKIIEAHSSHQMKTVVDYRLNERHYGELQGYSKTDVEAGKFGHHPADVQAWRRSWYAVPPLLNNDDPRREYELKTYSDLCGGPEYVPRGESLDMVAKKRLRPFLSQVLTPLLDQAAIDKKSRREGSTGLVVAHANSLRALIGVICEVETDPTALTILEALKIPTGVPLVLQYQSIKRSSSDLPRFQVDDLPEAEECIIDFDSIDGIRFAEEPPSSLGHSKLPVWPLNQCLPVQELLFRDRKNSLVQLRETSKEYSFS